MGEPERVLRQAENHALLDTFTPQKLDSAVTFLKLIATTNAAAIVNSYWAKHGRRTPGPEASETDYALNATEDPTDDGGLSADEEKFAATFKALAIMANTVASIWAEPTEVRGNETPGPRIDVRVLFERFVEVVQDLEPLGPVVVDIATMEALPDVIPMADHLGVPPYLRETIAKRDALRNASQIIMRGDGPTDLEGLQRNLELLAGYGPHLQPGAEA